MVQPYQLQYQGQGITHTPALRGGMGLGLSLLPDKFLGYGSVPLSSGSPGWRRPPCDTADWALRVLTPLSRIVG